MPRHVGGSLTVGDAIAHCRGVLRGAIRLGEALFPFGFRLLFIFVAIHQFVLVEFIVRFCKRNHPRTRLKGPHT